MLPRALGFWVERLVRHGIKYAGPTKQIISFEDHDGSMLEIVAHPGAEARPAWEMHPALRASTRSTGFTA